MSLTGQPVFRVAQAAVMAAFAIILLRPLDVPDPFSLGVLNWTTLCAAFAALALLAQALAGTPPSSPVTLPIVLYVAISAVNTIFAVDRINSAWWLASLIANVAIFYATAGTVRAFRNGARAWLAFLYASTTVLMVLATAHHAEISLLVRSKSYAVPEGWSGYPELAMLGAVNVALLVAAVQTGSRRLAAAAALQLPLALAALALLYARGAWIAIAVVVAAAGSIVIARRGRLMRLAVPAAVAAALIGLLVVTNPLLRHLVTGGIDTNIEGNFIEVASPRMRLEIWRRSLRMAADYPLGGIGPGNFQQVFERKYNRELNTDGRRGVHAHNDWLQQFGELGLPGGIAYLILWAAVLRVGWKRAVERGDFRSVGSFLALLAIAGTNLLTNMFFMITGGSGRLHTLAWMLFALVAGDRPSGDGVTPAAAAPARSSP
jgi:O-antigen ligase